MKLEPEQGIGHVVRAFAGGRVFIGEAAFSTPVILTARRIITDWPAPPVQQLGPDDLQRVLDLEPEVILLGTGVQQLFPPFSLSTAILRQGVALEIMATAAACRTFNVLVAEYRPVAAVLYMA